jgi:hypothetical protein
LPNPTPTPPPTNAVSFFLLISSTLSMRKL